MLGWRQDLKLSIRPSRKITFEQRLMDVIVTLNRFLVPKRGRERERFLSSESDWISYGICMSFNPGPGKNIPESEFSRNRQERIKYSIEFKLTHFNKVIIYNLRIRASKTRFHNCQHPVYLKYVCLMFHLHSGKKNMYIYLLAGSNLNTCMASFIALPTIGLLYSPRIVLQFLHGCYLSWEYSSSLRFVDKSALFRVAAWRTGFLRIHCVPKRSELFLASLRYDISIIRYAPHFIFIIHQLRE